MIGFQVYIDESGDEGFVFNEDGTGSSRWFVISAVIVRKDVDVETVKLIDRVRTVRWRQAARLLHAAGLPKRLRGVDEPPEPIDGLLDYAARLVSPVLTEPVTTPGGTPSELVAALLDLRNLVPALKATRTPRIGQRSVLSHRCSTAQPTAGEAENDPAGCPETQLGIRRGERVSTTESVTLAIVVLGTVLDGLAMNPENASGEAGHGRLH